MMKWRKYILAITVLGYFSSFSSAVANLKLYELQYPGTFYNQDVKAALRDIAGFLKLDLVLKEEPKGTVSNEETNRTIGEILDGIALEKTFLWYVANGTMYVVPDTDMAQVVFDIRNVQKGEINQKIYDLGVYNAKYQIRYDNLDQTALIVGPSGYVDLLSNIILISGGEQLGGKQDGSEIAQNNRNQNVPIVFRGRTGG